MNRPPTMIVAAMAEELTPLLRRLTGTGKERYGGLKVTTGNLDGTPVIVACTGEGDAAAGRGMSALLDQGRPGHVVIVGVSGGLCSTLAPGALIAGRSVVRDGEAAPSPDATLLAAALRAGRVADGTLVSTREILCTPSSKAGAYREFAGDGPAAVDLETHGYASAAGQRGVPWVAVRAICDTADEELPLDFNRFLGDDGRIRRERIALHAMSHPSVIPALRRMQERVTMCAQHLGQFVADFVNTVNEDGS